MAERRWLLAGLACWALLALAFAWQRVPFDDEWFSWTLLTEVGAPGFWASLEHDVHPPWLAMLDAVVHALQPERLLLHGLRIAMVVAALCLLAPLCRRALGLPPWVVALAALHPIVFYYGASLRWYPLLLLAHACRHWAIWSDASERSRKRALLLGAALGSAAGYIDVLFLAHDLGWWILRHRVRQRLRVPLLAAGAALAVYLVSPLWSVHRSLLAGAAGSGAGARGGFSAAAGWAVLGPLGEALPHWGLLLLGPAVFLLGMLGLRRASLAARMPQFASFIATLAGAWLVATGLGVWVPRYSLELWLWMTVGVIAMCAQPGRARLVGGVALVLIALGLATTVSGTGFFKADLNRLPDDVCAALTPDDGTQLYVLPYHRTRMQIERGCGFPAGAQVLQIPHVRHTPEPAAQLRELEARLPGVERVTLIELTSESSLSHTRRRVRKFLERRCSLRDERLLLVPPHAWLRTQLLEGPERRLRRVRYRCGG